MFNKLIVLILAVFSLTGCATGHCRGKKSTEETRSVFVYKPDGSKQCAQDDGVSVGVMAKELDGIVIRSMVNKPDGMMHMMVCGGATGKVNVYEIAEKDLAFAQKKGFKVLDSDEKDQTK